MGLLSKRILMYISSDKHTKLKSQAQTHKKTNTRALDTYLLFELCELIGQVGDESHRRLKFLLQTAQLVLFSLSVTAHQRHGSHTWEPVQIVFL